MEIQQINAAFGAVSGVWKIGKTNPGICISGENL
jgi:hypothetical protein